LSFSILFISTKGMRDFTYRIRNIIHSNY
jgi:hypothetical protein